MPSPMPARATTSNRSPIAVRINPIFVCYRRPSPVSRVRAFREGTGRSRTTRTHCAAIGFHFGEEIIPGTLRGLQTVPVKGELVHELVHGRICIGDAPWLCDDEHLPVLQLLYVVYRVLET